VAHAGAARRKAFLSYIVQDIQNLPDLPPKLKMPRLLNEKGYDYGDKCPEKLIS
jgi:hypothetical protein